MKYYRLEICVRDNPSPVCIREIPMKTETNRAIVAMHNKLIKWAYLNYPEAHEVSVDHVEYYK
jgi:hypothetical protein